ncbi:PREDICTED: uncharacterized protein LOC105954556 [Erythranthe guttata]|uniref:uncharacterized protein LOC105954556 n=1 Tax=Erythranthe guttata TaxID=4155 RepID=UPI00064DF80C|nr:PREDICTED: uncharacterized protein LOC105954556 [Erythranthe guttata]|eukprot:XP_012833682.1 PREDICTED: uncharacterized protein LOC105954556 [Erythranthe guttata]
MDTPSTYNVILGRPTLNKFEAIPSTVHTKLKFPVGRDVREVKGDHEDSRKCYVDGVHKASRKREELMNTLGGVRESIDPDTKKPRVMPAEELLIVQLKPSQPGHITRIGSGMGEALTEELIQFLRKNCGVFSWTPEDLRGINTGFAQH